MLLLLFLDPTYADKAILCADGVNNSSFAMQLSCERPGTQKLGEKLKLWLQSFVETTPSAREYWPLRNSEECSFTADEYLRMYNILFGEREFYRLIL